MRSIDRELLKQKQRPEMLMRGASLEVMPRRLAEVSTLAGILRPGTLVFIPHLPGQTIDMTVAVAVALFRAGFEPVPHLAARRIPSEDWLALLIARLCCEAGVRRVLLIGGDVPSPAGPFRDTHALLHSSAIAEARFSELLISGYPEGHPSIDAETLERALLAKIDAIQKLGAASTVVSQFGFNSAAILDFAAKLAQLRRDVGLRIGLAGPADPFNLLKFAMVCGVVRSARTAMALRSNALRLMGKGDPSALVEAVATGLIRMGVDIPVHFHFFSFGGVAATARWMAGRATFPEALTSAT